MALVTFPRQLLVDLNGDPRVGAKANFYASGTVTPITTYTTAAYAVAHANPVESAANGLFPAIYINPAENPTYKVVVMDSADVTIYSDDAIPTPWNTVGDIAALSDSEPVLGSLERTNAEIAAGVTPTNYAYAPGDGRRYGALPSASASANVTAFNAALASNQYVRIIEPGTYTVNDSLLPISNQTIELSQGVTLKSAASIAWIDTGIFDIAGRDNITIIGGVLDGNKANNATGRTYGVRVFESTKITLIGLTCQNMPGSDTAGTNGGDGVVVYGNGTAEFKMIGCSMLANVRQGLSLVEVTGATITGCLFRGTTGTNPGAGIDIEGDDVSNPLKFIAITGCAFDDNNTGLIVTSFSSDVSATGNVFRQNRGRAVHIADTTRCVFSSNEILAGASVDGSPDAHIQSAEDVIFSDNLIQGVGANTERQGLLVESSSNVKITGNLIRDTYRAGMQIGTTSMSADVTDCTVDNNTLFNCVESGAAAVGAMIITGNSGGATFYPLRLTVTNNHFRDARTAGNEADYAINHSAIPAATVAAYRFEGNYISGFTADIPGGTELPLRGSVTWNPGNLVDGAGETSPSITVRGAALGDAVLVFPPYDLQDITCSGYVQASEVVEIRLQNESTAAVDLASGTWRVKVVKANQ